MSEGPSQIEGGGALSLLRDRYLHVKHVIADYGIGRYGDFQFKDVAVALDYVRERRLGGDLTVFSNYEPEMVSGELWSSYRSHIVLTPADNNSLDVWQPKRSNEPWEKRLVRNGYFILEPKPKVRLVK